MSSAEEYLSSLDERSVWVFTKQETDFDEAYNATRLFSEITNFEDINIEQYFAEHHYEYDVETDRHRILVIPQMYGLLTKTPFYQRGVQYNKEKVTAVFDCLEKNSGNQEIYNQIKTEQLLKLKIHAIIDTANNNSDYHILPVTFIYEVLKKLQLKYGINEISIDHLYTYVMTCKSYDQLDDAVEYIKDNAPVSEYVSKYKGLSRVLVSIKKNTNLFLFLGDKISINPVFDNYFYNHFFLKYDLEELNEVLYRDVDYSYFLYNVQGFNINLIDEPKVAEELIQEMPRKFGEIIETETSDEENDDNYIEKVDDINESNVNTDVAKGASRIAPVQIAATEISKKYKRNPLLGKIAIQNAYYCCEVDPLHKTFISAKTKKNFMEAHHLVPVKYQQDVWKVHGINVDCVENIVSLCPTCHRAFHNGTKEVKREYIKRIFDKILPRYMSIDFNISIEDIYKYYNC